MKWAFWKRKPTKRRAPASEAAATGPGPDFDPADTDAEEAAARNLRVRTRRRLIGACALLLAAVIAVPMVLDPTPHAVPDTIPIDLPSDKTAFAPHLPAPAPDAATDTGTAIPAAPGAAADTAADVAAPAPAAEPAPATHGHKHGAPETTKSDARHAAGGHIFLQAAAMSRESAARELAGRITKGGLTPFVERTETAEGPRFRVRLGPFASRTEAEHARARLKAMGVDANIVGA